LPDFVLTILISKVPGRALRLAYQNNRLVRAPSMPRRLKEAAPREGFFASVPERVAMKISGHKTRAVFDRYHIVSPADLQEAARRIAIASQN